MVYVFVFVFLVAVLLRPETALIELLCWTKTQDTPQWLPDLAVLIQFYICTGSAKSSIYLCLVGTSRIITNLSIIVK